MRRGFRWTLLVCLFAGAHVARAAEAVVHARLDLSASTFEVHDDLTYVETTEIDYTLLTPRGLNEHERSQQTFYPDSQSLDIMEAWVTEPDGTRVPVTAENMFTRPSAASEEAPGFVGSMTTTVLFPRLREGSQTHIKYRLTQKTPPLLGFNVWDEAAFDTPTTTDWIDITLPARLNFSWAQRGGYSVTDATLAGTRHIHAERDHTKGLESEPSMVSTSDFQPIFLGSTLPDMETIGAIYYRQSRDRAAVTPEISALAATIAGDATGLDAARRIYDWVATHIRYVAVYLDPNDGWVPHAAEEVLRNGYGDCKDHVVIMQALLAARGIKAEAALIDWGNRTKDLPLQNPGQFNHAIVYLPDYDVFANPTNPYATFDALDRRLAGKLVVIATEHGHVSRTPPSRPEANRYRIESRVRLLPDGTLEGSADLSTSANLDSAVRSAMANAISSRSLVERLLNNTPEGGFGEYRAGNPHDLEHPFSIAATWTSPHGIAFQGRDAFAPIPTGPDLRPPQTMRSFLISQGDRHFPFMVGAGEYTWVTSLALPAGIAITALPPDEHFSNDAGSFSASYERTESGLSVTRRLTILRDVYEAAEYPELKALLYAPIDDSRAVAVLEREEQAGR
jgi:transglutaminase-like putative cysteine protease